MSFVPTVRVLLALLVALLMPLEQARCACAAMREAPAPAAERSVAAATHACCAARAATATEHNERQQAPAHQCSTGECGCGMTAAESTPATTLAPAAESSLVSSLAIVAVVSLLAPETVATPAAPALDVGRPPSLDALCAHGLRAPPAIA